MNRDTSKVKFLLAKGFKFQEIASAAEVTINTVYNVYLGKLHSIEIHDLYNRFTTTGKLRKKGL